MKSTAYGWLMLAGILAAGGVQAAELLDVVMVTYNLQQQDSEVVARAQALHKGIIVKKGLMSGHVRDTARDMVRESMQLIFADPGVHSMIVGTLNPIHLAYNVSCAKDAIGSC